MKLYYSFKETSSFHIILYIMGGVIMFSVCVVCHIMIAFLLSHGFLSLAISFVWYILKRKHRHKAFETNNWNVLKESRIIQTEELHEFMYVCVKANPLHILHLGLTMLWIEMRL